jgi:hypothetical protein
MSTHSPSRRRQVLQALGSGIGAGFVLPGLAGAEEAHRHVREQARLEQTAERAAASGARPTLLGEEQKQSLASLAEVVVPGSRQAGVADFLDRLIAVDSQDNQRDFLAALGTIEGEALSRFGRPWRGLSDEQQVALLTAVSTGPSSGVPTPPGRALPTSAAPPPPSPRDRFDQLKVRIAVAYYTSEAGLKELGYSGNVIHDDFTGCPHPAGHD